MNPQFLQKFIHQGQLRVVDHAGREHCFGQGEPSAVWRLHKASTLNAILRNPLLNLGETYLAGEWDAGEGGLHTLLTVLRINFEANLDGNRWLNAAKALLGSWNGVAASQRNASRHYDLDEPLFRACLDADMHYSCAYFQDGQDSLEKAQAAKCQHIAAKLHLTPGQRVLDIGCGWGGLATYLAERQNVAVTGLTLSAEQLRVAKARVRAPALQGRVDFRLQDYREHEGTYDRVVSVGMFEHVGKRNYRAFFGKLADCLAPDGVALLHTIASKAPPTPVNPWIRRYIFPGGYIPSLSDIAPAVERAHLVSTDIEVLRRHYALTLKAWNRRFQRVRSEFAASKGEDFCRMWEFYLVASQTAFEVGDLVVLQWQLAKRNAAAPITRDYLYADSGATVFPNNNLNGRNQT